MSHQSSPDERRKHAKARRAPARKARPAPLNAAGIPRWAAVGTFLILAVGALYAGRDFLMPLTLAFLLALVFRPIVRFLARRGLPSALSASLLVIALVLALVAGVYGLGAPLGTLIDKLPTAIATIERKLATVMLPVEKVMDASEQVDDLGKRQEEKDAPEVVVQDRPLVVDAATGAPGALAKVVFVLALLLFLLASGNLFHEKVVHALPTLTDKKRALTIAYSVERELSRYLFTITVINSTLGIAIGSAMWAVGMPNPVSWGVIAAVFNFVPYLGALAGVALSAIVALITFDSPGQAVAAPALYLMLTTLEGHFITPSIVGRRLEVNAVAVLLSLAFWGWLWGVFGALMAVPILVAVRVFSSHVPALAGIGMFLAPRDVLPENGARRAGDAEPDAPQTATSPGGADFSVPASGGVHVSRPSD